MRLSVIVPAYNCEDCIERCLDSLAVQTLSPDLFEVIAVDDGSTDQTGELIDGYASKYANFKAIHKQNGGTSSARNAGIEAAKGDYLGFVDSDDEVSPGMYEAMLEFAAKTGAPIVQTGRRELGEDGEPLPQVVGVRQKAGWILAEQMLFSLLLHEGDASFCTKIVKRRLLGDLRFPNGELNEDFWLLVQILERIEKLAVLPRVDYTVHYRMGSNSRQDGESFPRVFRDIVVNSDRVMSLVMKRHPGLIPAAERFALVQRLDYLLHIPVRQMRMDNRFYKKVVAYVIAHRREIALNPYLSDKQRRNLLLLSFAPREVRALHKRIKKL